MLHFIGCNGNGCTTSSFFCVEDPNNETLTFGTSVLSAMRALVDPGNLNGDDMTGGSPNCCSAANPDRICNAPDKPADATALCEALGYAAGTVIAVIANFCPEAEDFSVSNNGLEWSSDFVTTNGFGQEFTCTGFIN